jgi:DNA-binding NtrC family response regulator
MRKPRIIIFDDDVVILRLLKILLTDKNYEVLTFNKPLICPLDEKKTDNCIKENLCTDIFITDFEMPEINGSELLQKQSKRGCMVDIRNKAVISGNIDNENVIKKLGYVFFKKPLELSELSDWIDECEKRVDLSMPLGIL